MGNQRLYLFIVLCFLGLLLFQAWQEDYGRDGATAEGQVQPPAPADGDIPAAPDTAEQPKARDGDIPDVSAAPTPEAAPERSPAAEAGQAEGLVRGRRIQVETDLLRVTLDTHGGDVRKVELLDYPVSLEDQNPTRLMDDEYPYIYVAQSGFTTKVGEGPDTKSTYTAARTNYTLAEGDDSLEVALHWQDASGVRVTKVYRFERNRYAIEVRTQVENASNGQWKGSFYRQLKRTGALRQTGPRFLPTYLGGAIYTAEEHYEKIDFGDMEDEDLRRANVKDGWVAMLQHYFLGAWIPQEGTRNTFYTLQKKDYYTIGMLSPLVSLAPGESRTFSSTLFAGPKIQDRLEALSEGLDLTVDYGILTFLSKPLFWLLEFFHSLTGNWGWAIVLLTLLIKVVFYKLSETSYRSMANMRRVQPRMKALKERFGDDRQKFNQALMQLYKEEKINPLGGCLPILVQIPVFIALYWVLLESVEMRQAPFIFWIQDLATPDPYYVLPLLMGGSMLLQQKLNPAPMDPVQQKIMMTLPIVFTVFFAFFPAGLVLYWVANNSLSIAQQWVITRRIEGGAQKA